MQTARQTVVPYVAQRPVTVMERNFVFCTQCGAQNQVRNNFCARCGERLKSAASMAAQPAAAPATTLPCPVCNCKNSPDAEFCKSCSMPLTKDVDIDNQDDYLYLTVKMDEIDFENHDKMAPIFKAAKRRKILVDISHVKWMDSTGIGMLVTQTYRATRAKQDIKIIGMNKKIFEAVKSLSVDNVLDIYDSVNEARDAWELPRV